jgi:hypothetical protein
VRHISRRNPTSLFFDPSVGYERLYSTFRQQQADAHIEHENLSEGVDERIKFDPTQKENSLCVGVATIARTDVRYFRTTIGSILQGLHPQERKRINLILFIAHTEPTVHPAFWEPWLHNVADRVLLYNASLSEQEIEHLKWLEQDKEKFREKALFDYTFLLKACSDVGTPYIAMLEDDVIAMDGWFHRTQKALEKVVEKSKGCKKLSQ